MLWKFISGDGRKAQSSGDAITQRAMSIHDSAGPSQPQLASTRCRSPESAQAEFPDRHLDSEVEIFNPEDSIHDSAVSTQQQVGSTRFRSPEAAQAEIPDRQLDPNAESSSVFEPEDESNSRLLDNLQEFYKTDERMSPANLEGRDGSQAYLEDEEQQRQIMDKYKLPVTETIPENESIFGMRAVLYPDAAQRARLHIWNEYSPRPPARAREDTSREITPQVRMLHRKSPLRRIENPVRFSNGKERHPPPSTKVPKTPPTTPLTDFAPTSAGGSTTANTLFSATPLQSSPSIRLLSPNSRGPVSTDGGCNDHPIEKQDSGYLFALLNTPTPVRVQASVKGTHHPSGENSIVWWRAYQGLESSRKRESRNSMPYTRSQDAVID